MLRSLFDILARLSADGSAEAASRFAGHSVCPREEEFDIWADEQGLAFEAIKDDVPQEPYGRFAILAPDSNLKRLFTVSGEPEFVFGNRPHACELLLGDLGSTVDRQMQVQKPAIFHLLEQANDFRFSYLLLRLPFDNVPSLRIRHRDCPGATGAMVGMEKQTFEWNEFNRNVQVACDDKRFASALMCKRMMDFLHEYPAWPIAMNFGWLSMTDFQSAWTVEETHNTLTWLHDFFETWSEHLVDTLLRR